MHEGWGASPYFAERRIHVNFVGESPGATDGMENYYINLHNNISPMSFILSKASVYDLGFVLLLGCFT
jgi:hypothetical protein